MGKTLKRLLALTLVLVMSGIAAPLTELAQREWNLPSWLNFGGFALEASAADTVVGGVTYTYTVSGTNATITKATGASGALAIPSTLDGYTVTTLAYNAFNGTSITSVTIPKGVTSMGSAYSGGGATPFSGASLLRTVIFESGTTAIPTYALQACSQVTAVSIPNTVTSIGNYAFYGCSGFTDITIPNSVATIGAQAFYSCTKMTSLYLPSSVTDISSSAFANCTNLSAVAFNAGLKNIGSGAFDNCGKITEILLPGTLTSIGYNAFNGTSITSVTIPKGVTSMGSAYSGGGATPFSGASLLRTVIFESGTTAIPTYALQACSQVTAVSIPNTVTSIGNYAFYGCTNITIYCIQNSFAHQYAYDNSIPFVFGQITGGGDITAPSGTTISLNSSSYEATIDNIYGVIITANITTNLETIPQNFVTWSCSDPTAVVFTSANISDMRKTPTYGGQTANFGITAQPFVDVKKAGTYTITARTADGASTSSRLR